MRIKGVRKDERRSTFMLNVKEISKLNVNDSAYDEWNDLCNKCSSIVEEAGMTYDDIDNIVRKVKEGTIK